MDLLIGTESGVIDVGGRTLSRSSRVDHVVRHGDDWWAVGEDGLLRNGEPVAAPPPGTTLNCVTPGRGRVRVGADSARLLYLEDGRLIEDPRFADAPGRESWHTPWGGPPDVRSMSLGPEGTLYVNVHVGGILRYEDSDITPTLDIDADVHQVVAHPERPGVVVAATARGLAWSENGRDFAFRTDGLTHTYCRAVAVDGDTVVVSASRGPRGGESRLFHTSLEGGPLRACEGLPTFGTNIDTHCVAVGPAGCFVANGGTVWSSYDGGDTWAVAAGDLPTITSLTLASGPSTN